MNDIDELALKHPFWTSSVVDARLRDTFAQADSRDAAVLLSALVGDDPSGDSELGDLVSCRLMLAALKVSDGDLLKLGMWVDVARVDPRDLIAAAEYRRQLQGEGDAAVEADLTEYLIWVSVDAEPSRAN
ncbi:MAG: hypothetical protein U1E26_08980 [Coriobacteriia bacterium]|nr:hypothetical protein [Coriobacteriia bacterium]